MADRGSWDSVQDQAGIPPQESEVPIIRPRFKAEIREIHED